MLEQGDSRSKRLQDFFWVEKRRGSEPVSQSVCHQNQETVMQRSLWNIQGPKGPTPLASAAHRKACTLVATMTGAR